MDSSNLVSILQAAVGPVILISGAGLLILSMTNRLARVVDRARQLGAKRRESGGGERERALSQLNILMRRAVLLRRAISFATFSVLIAAILVIDLFLTAYLHAGSVTLTAILFTLCLLSLILSLIAFLQDLNVSLVALNMELDLPDDRTKS